LKANEPGAVLFDPFTGKPATLSDTPGEGYYHMDEWRRETSTDMGKQVWLFNPLTGVPRTQYAMKVNPYFVPACGGDEEEAVDHGRRISSPIEKWCAEEEAGLIKSTSAYFDGRLLSDEESKANASRYRSQSMQRILSERESRYGDFESLSTLSQALKSVARGHAGWDKLPDGGKEALEMTLHKIARIVNGDCTYMDSWDDAGGYLMRGAEASRRTTK
jgi:hypothetical protein